ncbi:HRT3 (YLR097C) [Zygosaccharomyces parabailii]|uniref:ZYBA0S07-02982g1_1 n=1 Tax=Zygosaccharomyces bailii (strain CLIB 213 / ATCC 58445 / CBS 680 / BCRC 21525 / NBRC 1098 / NCYC 1416 / NRRL Y-2227) TaxID=1333698 RepID=A0A8J2X948_ZYGB2|nr:HRT3 (YLR097C) [Zygosaccharomyces parabailii]CDF90523.1 ZYBA0S07-02982g1_1 [Zygosaccharomyces bailii CLIB 213]
MFETGSLYERFKLVSNINPELLNRGILHSKLIRSKMAVDSAKEAIACWEKAVQKERDGSMNDAIKFYREALKTHEDVEKLYRNKLLEEYSLHEGLGKLQLKQSGSEEKFDHDNKERCMDPCWLLNILPNDILARIVHFVVLQSGESWLQLSLTCSTFNHLCFHETDPYRTFAHLIYPKQCYDQTSLSLNGVSNLQVLEDNLWGNNYPQMLKKRPYVKFEGLYISVVNYLRYGANENGSRSWINPIHMITYYRYFRFYPDGRCLRLLTTDEPSLVVSHFSIDTPPKNSELCHWSLGFDHGFGHLTITRSSSKYRFVEELQIKDQGFRIHQRLKWLSSIIVDKEGEVTECSMKKEKPFFFSRVRSYVSAS